VKAVLAAGQNRNVFRRHVGFLGFGLVSLFVFWKPLRALVDFALTHDYASHIILVIPASAYILYRKRRAVFQDMQVNMGVGLALVLVVGGLLWIYRYPAKFFPAGQLSIVILACVVFWISGFVLVYGARASAKARFPLLFLLLMVPLPEPWIGRIIFVLQAGSATVAYGLLRLLDVPVFQRGFTLVLPTLDIEVAKQCSGIRSSLALFITNLLLGEFLLRSTSRKLLLVLATLPILIVKNGVRIVTLSLLSIYVSRSFLHGWIHTSGGIVFYSLALFLLIPIVVAFRRADREQMSQAHVETPLLMPGEGLRARPR